MWRSAALASSLVLLALLGCHGALAIDRVVVLRGDRCPDGISAVSPGEASAMAASACIVIDPTERARLGISGSATVSTQTCGARAAAIESLGAVLCRLRQAARPQRGAADASRRMESPGPINPRLRRAIAIFRVLALWAQWSFCY